MATANRREYRAFEEPAPATRRCDHPDCACAGEFRAPKSRQHLNDYWWFCLEHVREYNRAWNYYQGMSADQIEREARRDTVWDRPTWPMGSWRAEQRLRSRIYRSFAEGVGDNPFHAGREAQEEAKQGRPLTEHESAMKTLELAHPLDLKTLKARYKALVKLHPPDANGGSRDAEEKFKTINHAYSVLKAGFAS